MASDVPVSPKPVRQEEKTGALPIGHAVAGAASGAPPSDQSVAERPSGQNDKNGAKPAPAPLMPIRRVRRRSDPTIGGFVVHWKLEKNGKGKEKRAASVTAPPHGTPPPNLSPHAQPLPFSGLPAPMPMGYPAPYHPMLDNSLLPGMVVASPIKASRASPYAASPPPARRSSLPELRFPPPKPASHTERFTMPVPSTLAAFCGGERDGAAPELPSLRPLLDQAKSAVPEHALPAPTPGTTGPAAAAQQAINSLKQRSAVPATPSRLRTSDTVLDALPDAAEHRQRGQDEGDSVHALAAAASLASLPDRLAEEPGAAVPSPTRQRKMSIANLVQ